MVPKAANLVVEAQKGLLDVQNLLTEAFNVQVLMLQHFVDGFNRLQRHHGWDLQTSRGWLALGQVEFLQGIGHRIRKYLKQRIPSLQFQYSLAMDYCRGRSLPQKAECLALHKIKAKSIKQNLILNQINPKQQELAKKVAKYETFLSHKMMDKISTQDLKVFQQEIKEYRHRQSTEDSRVGRNEKQVGIQKYLDSVRRATKCQLRRSKDKQKTTEQDSSVIYFSPKQSFCLKNRMSTDQQSSIIKFKKALEVKRHKRGSDKQFKLKGNALKRSLLELMEKTSLMQSYNTNKNEPLLNIFVQNQEEDLLTTDRLKFEQERLGTVLQSHNNSSEFRPIGKRSNHRGYHYHSQKKVLPEIPFIIRKQSYFNISRKQTEPSSSNRASLSNHKCTRLTKPKTNLTSSDPSHSNSMAEMHVKA